MPSEREYFEQDVADSYLNDPQNVITILWYRDGKQPGKSIDVGFDDSQDQGSNQVDGDGLQLESSHGKRIRSTATIDAPASLEFKPTDTFFIYGQLWSYRRPVGRDSARQSFDIATVDGDFTQKPRTRRR